MSLYKKKSKVSKCLNNFGAERIKLRLVPVTVTTDFDSKG